MRSHYRLGIDAGGTFTDYVLDDKLSNVKIILGKLTYLIDQLFTVSLVKNKSLTLIY